jgi:hypothetical protein
VTTDEAIALIPMGWRLRLTSYDRGWTAELFRADVGLVTDEASTPGEAVRLVVAEARRY